MHKKNNVFKKWLAGVAMFGLVASGAVVIAPAANATTLVVPAGGLDFLQNFSVGGSLPSSTTTYTNIDGNGTVAVVELLSLTNSVVRKTGATWNLNWTGFAPANTSYYLMQYSIRGGTPVVSNQVPAGTFTGQMLSVPAVVDRNEIVFRVAAYDSNNAFLSFSPTITNTSGTVDPGEAGHTYTFENNALHYLDYIDAGASSSHRYISTDLRRTDNSLASKARIKVSFLDSAQSTPVSYGSLAINAYDIDNSQTVSFENITSYQLTSPTNIDSIVESAPGDFSFTAKAVGTSTGSGFNDPNATAYSIGRVKVNYQNVSEIFIEFGFPSNNEDNATFEFDFGDGGLWAGGSAPEPVQAGSTPTPTPVMSAIDVNPTNITVDNEIITILGANLNTVTDVYIGGVRVPVFTQTGNRLQVRAPKGLSGLVDLELKSSLNDVLMTKKLNFGGTAAAGTRKATLIVGGFDHNSRKLTKKMKNRIDRWLNKNSDLSTLTCTGFTSLPRRTSDVTLSTNRGITACNFSKRERPELETSVSQGIEDPRPGSNVRRVRLVLTP